MSAPIGIYVHVPFCAKKCPYCDFYSGAYRSAAAGEYLTVLCADLASYADRGITADTLYFGGGTPSLLPPAWIAQVVETVRQVFGAPGEITIEANPNTLTPARVEEYLRAGVNRLSVGVQSFDDAQLRALGRGHTALQAESALRMAKEAGMDNLSLDLMLGTPYQTKASLQKTLETALRLPIQHLSAYLLKVEPGTAYWESPLLRECMEDDALAEAYEESVAWLNAQGMRQYEISNFARPGKESRHNLKYWHGEEYLGFGPAAHSFFGGKRFANPPSLEAYLAHGSGCAEVLEESPDPLEEYLILGLRLTEGISLARYASLGGDADALQKSCAPLLANGYAFCAGERLALTPRGFLISNTILANLLEKIEKKVLDRSQ